MSKPLAILNKGESWIAIDKPAGVSMHNGSESDPDVLTLLSQQLKRPAEDLHLVHRLDRETSGAVIVGLADLPDKVRELHELFSSSLERSSSIKKIYRAIVHGRLKDTSGHWNWPISDKSEGRKSPQGATADRKPSSTLFRVTRDNSFFSDLELILETGRQHQIRKHAALASHPVAGDERYGDLRGPKTLKRLFAIDRMLLHAWRIELSFAGQKIEIEAPLPAEFSRVFEPPSIESK